MPGFAGYLWGKAAMHPSVCALRRIHRPVCGARIARRALKHACALRPSNLLRRAFSAAGGARLRSPLQGRLWGDRHPEGSPVRGAVGVSRLRGAAPCLANTLSGRRKAPGGRERPPCNVRQTDGITGNGGLCSRAARPQNVPGGPISHNFHKTARRWGKTGAKAAQHRQNFARNPAGTFTAGPQDAKIMPLRQAAGALDAGQLAAL